MRRCIKATVGAVVEREGHILLALRNHGPFYNHWCIPGGHIEFGEPVEAAVKRELAEETGLRAVKTDFFNYYTEYYPELEWHAVALIFSVLPEGELKRQEAEVKELRWFLPEEIEELSMAFEHGRIVRDYLTAAP